jgi:hypothetical protein
MLIVKVSVFKCRPVAATDVPWKPVLPSSSSPHSSFTAAAAQFSDVDTANVAKYPSKDASYSVKDASYSVKDASYSVKDDSYSVKDASYSVKDASYPIKDVSYPVNDASYPSVHVDNSYPSKDDSSQGSSRPPYDETFVYYEDAVETPGPDSQGILYLYI